MLNQRDGFSLEGGLVFMKRCELALIRNQSASTLFLQLLMPNRGLGFLQLISFKPSSYTVACFMWLPATFFLALHFGLGK